MVPGFALRVGRGMRLDQPTGPAATSILARKIARMGHRCSDARSSQLQLRKRAVPGGGARRELAFPETTCSVTLEYQKSKLLLSHGWWKLPSITRALHNCSYKKRSLPARLRPQ